MGKIRVLHIVSSEEMNGAEKLVKDIIGYLSHTIDFAIICRGIKQAEQYGKVCSDVYVYNTGNVLSKLQDVKKTIKKFEPDIIHAHDNRASILSYLALKTSGHRSIIVSHIHNSYRFIKTGGIYKTADRIFRKKYQGNIFCGQKVMDYYKDGSSYFDKLKNVMVLPNFTDVKMNRKMVGDRHKCDDKVNIAFVGRFEAQKGLVEFFEALKQNSEYGKDNISLFMIGDGELRSILEKLAAQDKLGLSVSFSGYINNPQEVISKMDLLVLPSKFEGLPLTLLEAMSLSVPAIAMDVGSISEVISDGENGWLIQADNYTEFIKKMLLLCKDKNLLSDTGEKAQRTISDRFDIDGYMEKLNSIYYNLIVTGGNDE